MKTLKMFRPSGICILAAFLTSVARPQTTSGTIVGTVTDPSGAVVPSAKITLTVHGGANKAAGVMLFLLATASGNTAQFAQHYPLLLGLNAALAALLAALVAWQVGALWRNNTAESWAKRSALSANSLA